VAGVCNKYTSGTIPDKLVPREHVKIFVRAVCITINIAKRSSDAHQSGNQGTDKLIVPVVLYGCKTWSVTLSEGQRLGVSENRVLRRKEGRKEITDR
jgi:hypothetical protein